MVNKHVPKYVTQARAAFILGLPVEEIGRISRETGLGQEERAGSEVERFFTYEELQKICVVATRQGVTAH